MNIKTCWRPNNLIFLKKHFETFRFERKNIYSSQQLCFNLYNWAPAEICIQGVGNNQWLKGMRKLLLRMLFSIPVASFTSSVCLDAFHPLDSFGVGVPDVTCLLHLTA